MMSFPNDHCDWIWPRPVVTAFASDAGGRCSRFTHAAKPSRTGDTQKPAAMLPVVSEIAPARTGLMVCPNAKLTVRSEMAAVQDEIGNWRCTTMVMDVGPARKLPPKRIAE